MGLKVPVRCVETGEVFDSMTAAGLSVGKNYLRVETGHGDISSHTNISGCISGINKTAGGYRWELVHTDSKVSSILPPEEREEKLPKIYKAIKAKPPQQPKMDYPPEGYVYIFRNRWHPENIYKIGSTDNLEGRRATARTWGPYECEYYLEVGDCKEVERDVHERLSNFRVESPDIGNEHFEVDLKVASKTIELAGSHDSLRRILDSALAA
jgi:hypothetical protein